MKTGLDLVTKRVLACLADDAFDLARAANAAGCSEEVARTRLERLRETGVLKGMRLELDPAKLGRPHEVLVTGVPSGATDLAALRALCEADGVTRVFALASRTSIAFTMRGRDPVDLEERARAIARDAGLEHAGCTLVVNTLLDDPLHGVRDLLPAMEATVT